MNQELQAALAEIARKLGTSVEHIWPQLVAAQRAQWVTIFAVTCALATAARLAWTTWKKMPGDTYSEREQAWWALMIGVVLAVISGLLMLGLAISINQLVYPEAAAFSDLIEKVKR